MRFCGCKSPPPPSDDVQSAMSSCTSQVDDGDVSKSHCCCKNQQSTTIARTGRSLSARSISGSYPREYDIEEEQEDTSSAMALCHQKRSSHQCTTFPIKICCMISRRVVKSTLSTLKIRNQPIQSAKLHPQTFSGQPSEVIECTRPITTALTRTQRAQ